MDPKQKLIAIAVGSVCGLIILALAVLLVLQIGHMNEARAARDNAEATINNYYAAKPYPSEDNRAVRKQDGKIVISALEYQIWSIHDSEDLIGKNDASCGYQREDPAKNHSI